MLYAGQSRAGANRTYGVYGIRTAYKPYGTLSTISYFYGQPYGTIPYGMVITAVRTVRFILLATLAGELYLPFQGKKIKLFTGR